MTSTMPRTDQWSSDAQSSGVGAAHAPNSDQPVPDAPNESVAVGPNLRADHVHRDTQNRSVGAARTPEQAIHAATPTADAPVRAPFPATDHSMADAQNSSVGGGPVSPATIPQPMPKGETSPGISNSHTDQATSDAQRPCVGVGQTSPAPAISSPTPIEQAPVLVDHHLAVLANRVNGLENFRKASANQLGALTQGTEPDEDGVTRGYGLPAEHPAVIQSQAIVDAIKKIEDQTVRELEKKLRKTPLGPWILAQKGLGAKTIARLLAATGDPYWNSLHDRPRTVSELWSFCGYRPGQKKAKGEKVNWSPEAKMRAHLLMDPIKKMLSRPCHSVKGDKGEYLYAVHVEGECVCSPYRVMYDQARDKYRDTLHPADCVRCGPAGKPALAGSVRSAKHQDAMAYRLVKKAILRDLWRESARLHGHPGDHGHFDAQCGRVAGALTSQRGTH
jgi:hypothetical protein